MFKEAADFLEESNVLASALAGANDDLFALPTLFKEWTIEDVIAHLHMWNNAALLTLEDKEKFQEFIAYFFARMTAGDDHPQAQRAWLNETQGGLSGRKLFNAWGGLL